MTWPQQGGTFSLGDFAAEKGGIIRDAKIVWQTHGTLNAARDNVILYPCSYTAQHPDMAWLIGPDGILDPTRWFIVIPNMFSNGLSSSAADNRNYPAIVTSRDNVLAQERLLREVFGQADPMYGWVPMYPSGWWSWTFAASDGRPYLQPQADRAAAVVAGCEIWSPRWQRGAFEAVPAAIERALNA